MTTIPDFRHILAAARAGLPGRLLLPVIPPFTYRTDANGAQVIVPVYPNDFMPGKTPGYPHPIHDNWMKLAKWTEKPVDDSVMKRANDAGANVGLLLGRVAKGQQFVFVDIDTLADLDPESPASVLAGEIVRVCLDALSQHIGRGSGARAPIWVRNTRPGRAGVLIRLAAEAIAGSKAVSTVTSADGARGGKIELLAHGQQVVIGGTHLFGPRGTPIRWFRTDRPNEFHPAPAMDDAIPFFRTRQDLDAAMASMFAALLKANVLVDAAVPSSSVGEPLAADEIAPPSAAKLAQMLGVMPHPSEQIDRDRYVFVMRAAAGCVHALRELNQLGDNGEETIAEAAIGWAARWDGVDRDGNPTTEEAEREKWETDFSRSPATKIPCWNFIRDLAIRLGNDDLRIETAQQQFAMEAQEAAVASVTPEGPAKQVAAVQWPTGFRMAADGLVWQSGKGSPERLTDPFEIVAETRSGESERWSLALQYTDRDGRTRDTVVPRGMTHRDPKGIAEMLESNGLACAPGRAAYDRLAAALAGVRVGSALRRRILDRSGWHSDGCAYFMHPSGSAVGLSEGEATLAAGANLAFTAVGVLDAWRAGIAAVAVGNTRLCFAIAAAFAPPLLEMAGEPNGGFHLVGESRRGKTSAVEAAASVWGDPRRVLRSWRGTANGIEAAAAATSDGLFILDELGQADGREVGDVIYAIANGIGRLRATITGGLRSPKTWRNLTLSTGEITIAAKMRSSGQESAAGLDVRLVNVPADAGTGHGLWENLHGHPDGAALSEFVKREGAEQHGTAMPAFLQGLVLERMIDFETLRDRIRRDRDLFITTHVPDGADGQVRSVAGRFGLVAVAGELATEFGVTGWPAGEATRASVTCFKAFLVMRGGTEGGEAHRAVRALRGYIEKHGEARFARIGKALPTTGGDGNEEEEEEEGFDRRSPDVRTLNRSGFVRDAVGGGLDYLFFSEAFADALGQVSIPSALKALETAGFLLREEGSMHATVRIRVDGRRLRLYAVTDRILGDDGGGPTGTTPGPP